MDRRQQVRRWLARRERLGLTYAELSRETGLAASTLAHWAWRLRGEEGRAAEDGQSGSAFVELVTTEPAASRAVEVVLRGERRLRIAEDFDEERLVRLVRALERC